MGIGFILIQYSTTINLGTVDLGCHVVENK